MTEIEIAQKLAAQEEEEKARNAFTRQQLEQVVNAFALSILHISKHKLDPTSFKIYLEEHQTIDVFMKSGNPVEIHIRMQDLADALIKKGEHLHRFKRLVGSALGAAPRLLHSLAVIPISDIARWHGDIERFKWHKGKDTDFLPKLLPDHEIHYDISLRIIATHINSDTRIVVSDRNFDLNKLRRVARETLSEEFYCEKEEK